MTIAESSSLNIVYSSDNKYAQHVGVSMLSLFENNKEFQDITVYLIDNNISPMNKSKLDDICKRYGRTLVFITFDEAFFKQKTGLNTDFSLSSYARLFLSSMIDKAVKKIVYLDCDSIVHRSLKSLWDTDIVDYYVAGVCDTVNTMTKTRVQMDPKSNYINAGMMLINLEKWREEQVERKFLDFIAEHNGHVFHHDQGVINGVLHDDVLILHPKYNAMTVFFTMRFNELLQYYGLSDYYIREELTEAVREPVFIHFTPAFVNRPWIQGCKHPLMRVYRDYREMSPWKGTELEKDNRRAIEKGVAFLYNHLPFGIANRIRKVIFH